ncbi:MAG: DJ-1/PfpI family protein [Leptolyngbyaceae cyanobacterium SM1_1_3]|nr:DJ-1/PfpI family protein [Leptolyngbyaceae cyanobacterium SM1_1_3]NJO11921.1 DJ-1/PfpI family protein [Leptolyngbyaceae cyanobacterium SL_1_1]
MPAPIQSDFLEIAILLYEGMTALDAIGPYEVLSRLPNTKIKLVAKEPGLVVTDTRYLALNATDSLTDVPTPNVILLPGGSAGTMKTTQNQAVLDWVRTAHANTQWTTAVCTGVFLLGASGLLTGIEATTHWASTADLAKYDARYQPARFVQSGKIITAAGVSAGIDMALYLAGQLRGEQVAKAIQLAIEYDPNPPFQSGSLKKADQEIVQQSRKLLRSWFLDEFQKFFPDQAIPKL